MSNYLLHLFIIYKFNLYLWNGDMAIWNVIWLFKLKSVALAGRTIREKEAFSKVSLVFSSKIALEIIHDNSIII